MSTRRSAPPPSTPKPAPGRRADWRRGQGTVEYVAILALIAVLLAGVTAWLERQGGPPAPPIDPLAAAVAPLGSTGSGLGSSAPPLAPPPLPRPLPPPEPEAEFRETAPGAPPAPTASADARPGARPVRAPGARRPPAPGPSRLQRALRGTGRLAIGIGNGVRRAGRGLGAGALRGARERLEEVLSDPSRLVPVLDPRAYDPVAALQRGLDRAGDVRQYVRELRRMPRDDAIDRLSRDVGEAAAREAIDLVLFRLARAAQRRVDPPDPPRPPRRPPAPPDADARP